MPASPQLAISGSYSAVRLICDSSLLRLADLSSSHIGSLLVVLEVPDGDAKEGYLSLGSE
jgi:hypothetical protein